MSLILEALRKSEQQRRLGEPPTLDSESAWAARRWHGAPARRARWPWVALVLTLVAAGAGAAWWLRPTAEVPPAPPTAAHDETPPPASATPTSAPASADGGPSGTQMPSTQAASAAEPVPQNMPDAAVASAPAVAGGALDPAVAARLDAPTPSPDGEYASGPAPADSVAVPATAPAAAPPPAEAPRVQPAPAEPMPAVAEPVAPAPIASAAPPPQPTAPPVPPASAPLAGIPPPSADTADVPLVYALPLTTRQALPPLALSMHVWNADPTRRFVILDDARAAEGETAGSEITVIEIRRDGVVLDHRGTRFFLPRSGY